MIVSFVIPLLNEAQSLPELASSIKDVMQQEDKAYEIIFVDDGSTDDSFQVLRDLHCEHVAHVKVVRFSRNYGKAAGLSVGIQKAQGDVIVTMDADLQDNPLAVPDMLKKLEEGWDVVSGWKKVRKDPVLTKNIPSRLFNFTTSRMSGLKLHDFNCGFKAYRADAAKSLEIYGERHRYLPVLAHWNGFRVTEVPVPHQPRKYGRSKYGLNRFWNGFLDLLSLLFLRRYLRNPLHFFGLLGIVLGLGGSGVLAWFGVQWIITGHIHLRPLMLLSLGAIIMGIQFVSIGLLGEMITNANPQHNYTIRETLD
ncbi:MAG: glycosyltransferase [Chitinivibrionales bacterium]|nr:glycosyltransferase [Chitinivibrionales bacterium]